MLETPCRISQFQRKLYFKAKQQPKLRFYTLYDKIYREDILEHAYHLVKYNGGSAGIDGITFRQIENGGRREAFLAEIKEVLREKPYQAQPVRRVYIPKADGSKRPLGIPTIRDRVVQMATKLVIEPIFEADFCDSSFGFRPKKSAHGAIKSIEEALLQGHKKVIDADLSKYFDTIPHAKLLKTVAKRICDKEVLHLIKLWLKAPVVEEDENGKKRYSGGKKNKKGTPQGGVISPLLANIYLHLMDKLWEINEFSEKLGARLVRYADDFVILCKSNTRKPIRIMKQVLSRLELNLNEQKTHIVNAYDESFNFLGFEFKMRRGIRNKKWYPHTQPSAKSMKRIRDKVTKLTNWKRTMIDIERVVSELNTTLKGWTNYFHYGNSSKKFTNLKLHVEDRMRIHLRKRHKIRDWKTGYIRFPSEILYSEYGLYEVPITAGWKKANALK